MSDEKGLNDFMDLDSSGWKHIQRRFEEFIKNDQKARIRLNQARIGFDLGSGMGQSAYALTLLAKNLTELHCVDDRGILAEPFRNIMGKT